MLGRIVALLCIATAVHSFKANTRAYENCRLKVFAQLYLNKIRVEFGWNDVTCEVDEYYVISDGTVVKKIQPRANERYDILYTTYIPTNENCEKTELTVALRKHKRFYVIGGALIVPEPMGVIYSEEIRFEDIIEVYYVVNKKNCAGTPGSAVTLSQDKVIAEVNNVKLIKTDTNSGSQLMGVRFTNVSRFEDYLLTIADEMSTRYKDYKYTKYLLGSTAPKYLSVSDANGRIKVLFMVSCLECASKNYTIELYDADIAAMQKVSTYDIDPLYEYTDGHELYYSVYMGPIKEKHLYVLRVAEENSWHDPSFSVGVDLDLHENPDGLKL